MCAKQFSFVPVLLILAVLAVRAPHTAAQTDREISWWLVSDLPEDRAHVRDLGEKAWPALQRILSSPNSHTEVVSMAILTIACEPKAKPVFLKDIRSRLHDPHLNVQMASLTAIGAMGDQSDCQTLRSLLTSSPNEGIRIRSIRNLIAAATDIRQK